MSIDALLGRPAQEGVRMQALALLESARVERARLDGHVSDDSEAVHDFRVALRRLRSLLKAHRPRLGGKVEKLRKELGDIADATGTARDAEVQLEWLAGARVGLSAARRPALDWLCARLEERKQSGYASVSAGAAQEFDDVFAKARSRLGRFRRDLTEADEPPLSSALADLLVQNAEELAGKLGDVTAPSDEERAHEARILGKQLRYLLEPLTESEQSGANAKTAVKDLKALQDVLGELHDAHVLGHVVQEAMIDFAAERARRLGASVFDRTRAEEPRDLRPGLIAVAEKVRDRRDGLFKQLMQRRSGVARLVKDVHALAEALGSRKPAVEIEKKFLLRGMPPVEGAEVLELEQGYVPGKRLVERLRRMRGPDGAVRLIRGMKLGAGTTRIEVEEEISPELFESMWPLTLAKRIVKTRYRVKAGELTWEIDRFAGRDLVVAEVELPSEDTPAPPPPWLEPFIAREVTGEKGYTNEALAAPAPATVEKSARKRVTRRKRR